VKKQRAGRASSAGSRHRHPLPALKRTALEGPKESPPKIPKAAPGSAGDPTILLFKELFQNGPGPGPAPGQAKPAGGVGRGPDGGDGHEG
jgi:hypothetical protein